MLIASDGLCLAAVEYRWLLDRGYPETASLKLVGDRRELGRDERMILFRGVASRAASEARRSVLLASPGTGCARGSELLVDGYNQALTVMHYLAGRPMFTGSDGLLRDAGGSHGRIADPALFERALALLARAIASLAPARVAVYLDAPVPGSAGHAGLFKEALAAAGLPCDALLERSADYPLKSAASRGNVLLASGDSAIAASVADAARKSRGMTSPALDESSLVIDLARYAIDIAFDEPPILDLGRLLAAGGPKEAV